MYPETIGLENENQNWLTENIWYIISNLFSAFGMCVCVWMGVGGVNAGSDSQYIQDYKFI